MKEKLINVMIENLGYAKFANAAMDIIVARQPKGTHMQDWDENVLCSIREFKKEFEARILTYSTIEDIYESEYDDFDVYKKLIDRATEHIADYKLTIGGWKKKGANA